MPSPRRLAPLLVAAILLVAAGCDGGAAKPKRQRKPKAEPPPAPVAVDRDAAVTVDEGRIAVAPPVGWKREPRSKLYLTLYVPGRGRLHPSVTVLGGDPPAGIAAVDAANHAAFVAAIEGTLAGTVGGEGQPTLVEKPTAVELGPHRAVVWTTRERAPPDGGEKPSECSRSAVVVGGRMYTVEARAPQGSLDAASRAAGLGVAAGIAPAPREPPAAAPAGPASEPAESAAPTAAAGP